MLAVPSLGMRGVNRGAILLVAVTAIASGMVARWALASSHRAHLESVGLSAAAILPSVVPSAPPPPAPVAVTARPGESASPVEPSRVAASAAPPEHGGIRHYGESHFPGGVLMAPWTFDSDDGSYDLLIHFHGHPRIVRESAEHAGLNALVAVVNLGEGSVRYKRPYRWRALYLELLHQIHLAASRRGVWKPRRRRIAVSAWSAGYGAVEKILRVSRGADRPDAVLILDGIHGAHLEDQPGELDPASLKHFLRAAREAAAGQRLFTITHSEYDPGGYVGAADAARYLFGEATEVARSVVEADPGDPFFIRIPSAGAVVKRRLQKKMVPVSDRRTGDFHVRGFSGNGRANHRSHLLQMGATVLPELRDRWRR